jgi:hypothetical protein
MTRMTLNEFCPEPVIRNPAPDAAAHGPAPGTTRAMTISNTRADPALAAAQAEVARLTAEVERLRGPVATYKRGYGPGDGDSAALAAQTKEQA